MYSWRYVWGEKVLERKTPLDHLCPMDMAAVPQTAERIISGSSVVASIKAVLMICMLLDVAKMCQRHHLIQ